MRPTSPVTQNPEPARTEQGDVTVATSKAAQPPVPFQWQRMVGSESRPNLETFCRDGYTSDKVFKRIIGQPGHHLTFKVEGGLIYYPPNREPHMLCTPCTEFQGRRITELIIDKI